MLGRSSSQNSKQSVEFVTGWLKDVGIAVKPKIVSEDSLTEIIGEGKFDMFEWGWVVEPDPNYQLSTFTCAKRSYKDGDSTLANLSDSFYCNPAYDALYAKQATQTDPAGRFRLTGVPDDPENPGPVRLRLVGRGHTLTADVDPADTDLVIVFEPPAR